LVSKSQQTTKRPLKKLFFLNVKLVLKNEAFYAEISNMKRKTATNFKKNLSAKQEAKKFKLVMLLIIQGFFLWCLTFFVELFCNFLKSFSLGIKILNAQIPIFIF